MSRRAYLGAGLAVLAIAGLVVLYDLAIETDEERLEALVEDVRGEPTMARARAARARWVDLEVQPLELSALGESLLYRVGELDALDERMQRGLAPLAGDRLSVVSHGIAVRGDEATITMRLLGRTTGMVQARFDLARHGDDFLVSRVVIQR